MSRDPSQRRQHGALRRARAGCDAGGKVGWRRMSATPFEATRATRVQRGSVRALAWLLALGAWGCERASQADPTGLVTRIEALAPAPRSEPSVPAVAPTPAPEELVREAFELPPTRCPEVARQARELSEVLPRQLDGDTLATAVTANGCDLTLEYQLVTLDAKDVSEKGMTAMRSSVRSELCSDRGALAVMQEGGRFTNVYYDRTRARIGLFSVAADDCGI